MVSHISVTLPLKVVRTKEDVSEKLKKKNIKVPGDLSDRACLKSISFLVM